MKRIMVGWMCAMVCSLGALQVFAADANAKTAATTTTTAVQDSLSKVQNLSGDKLTKYLAGLSDDELISTLKSVFASEDNALKAKVQAAMKSVLNGMEASRAQALANKINAAIGTVVTFKTDANGKVTEITPATLPSSELGNGIRYKSAVPVKATVNSASAAATLE